MNLNLDEEVESKGDSIETKIVGKSKQPAISMTKSTISRQSEISEKTLSRLPSGYSCEQLESSFRKTNIKRVKKAPVSPSSTTDILEFNDGCSVETKEAQNMIQFDPLTPGKESNMQLQFQETAQMLSSRVHDLQRGLIGYLTSKNTESEIANLIQSCLDCIQIESLSSTEFLQYLEHGIGKLLYTLVCVLEEFEKHLLDSHLEVPSSVSHCPWFTSFILSSQQIQQKKEKAVSLNNVLKFKAVSQVSPTFGTSGSDSLFDSVHRRPRLYEKKHHLRRSQPNPKF